MGLFDAFGVGGGSLSLQVQSQQVEAGGVLQGAVVFTAGRRAQQITNVTVKLACSVQVPQASGQMMQETRDAVAPYALTGAFTAQPGQTYQFPFQLQVPHDALGTTPKLVSWRVSANADIDGEIDPGAGLELMVRGHAYQPQAMMPMGGPQYQQPMGKDPYAQGKGDAWGKPHDPNDPYGKGVHYDPHGKGGYHDPNDPYGKGKGGGKY